MKKILIALFVLTSFLSKAQLPAGWDCSSPLVIDSIPYEAIQLNTQIMQNIYDASSCPNDQNYMAGKDLIMTYTSPVDQMVNITVSNTAQICVSVSVFTDCPDQPNSCYAINGSDMGSPALSNLMLYQGVTYYIVVSTGLHCFFGIGTKDYVHFDINIDPVVIDASVMAINSPLSGCSLTNSESVTVRLKNTGANSISNFPVSYQVNGGSVVTQNYTGTLAANAEANFTFSTPVDLSQAGTYNIVTYVDLSGDNITGNDSVTTTVVSTPGVSVYPYIESYEDLSSGWVVGGTNPSFVIGDPDKVHITNSFDSTNCYVTALTGNCNANENSWVESPCFDLSQMQNPILTFAYFNMTGAGYAQLLYSVDNGTTWQPLADNGSATGWFNGTDNWTGYSNKWVLAKRNMDDFIGVSNLRFRFGFYSADGAEEGFAFDKFMILDCIPLPTSGFNYVVDNGMVTFSNTSTDASNYVWSFGDSNANSSSLENPTFAYTESGTYLVKLIARNSCGADTTFQNITVVVTGIDKNEISSIAIYPNPSNGDINVEAEINSEFILRSVDGKVLVTKTLSSKKEVIKNLASGVYFIELTQKNSTVVTKVVIL